MTSSRTRIRESLLARVWEGQWLRRGPLSTDDGREVRVRSPGHENTDSGPDFLDAVIILDDEIITGDIELHLRSSDWRSHAHHLDPHFNSVILQVVLWHDSTTPARLQNGRIVPTVPLHEHLDGSLDDLELRRGKSEMPLWPCHNVLGRFEAEQIGKILERNGAERFYVKAAAFEMELLTEDPPEVLYRGLMGALGYVKNKGAFRELARRLPLSVLEGFARECRPEDRKRILQGLLLGGAGLLPSQCEGKSFIADSEFTAEMEAVWRSLGNRSSMSRADWHFFRMHPRNFPTNRLLGAAELIERHLEKGLLSAAVSAVNAAAAGERTGLLEDAFMVRGLVGRGRAREMVINVILPFCFAWDGVNASGASNERAFDLYRRYPKSGGNRITRLLGEMLGSGRACPIVRGAVGQQGLIHIYKVFCKTGRCGICPLNPV